MRKLLSIAGAILLVMVLTACSANEANEKGVGEQKGTGEQKITEEQKGAGEERVTEEVKKEYALTEEGIIKPDVAQEVIKPTADKVIQAISEKNAETLAEFVDPVKGLRFTPYTSVSLEKDIVFSKEEVKNFFKDTKVYMWGYYDGIGDEISLTPSAYYEKFIYTADFKNADKVGYNEVLSSGNAVENQFEVYEKPIIVEYYFTGAPEYDGLDWQSLRLVFEERENAWQLVGIIHNQWTI